MIQKRDLDMSANITGLRVRSGSPGVRNNVDGIINQSLQATDPKEFLKTNFKSDMKRFGLNTEMKKLKQFKAIL